MRTPEQQRAANLAKQKRFRRQHPRYKYRHDPLHLRKCPDEEYQASYRTFELADPRDPDMLPRVIGYARTDVAPAWDGLWSVRYLSRSRWAAWLRELETLRLKPVVRPFCTLGAVLPIGHVAAHRIVQLRLQTINEAFTGNRFKAPDWVLRNLEALDVGAGTVATPVG